MDVYLLIATIIIFAIFAIYEQIKASMYVTKCFTKEMRNKHNYITRVKALMLPKSMWIENVSGECVSNLVKANQHYQNYIKRAFISFGIFATTLFLIASPSIYYLLTH